MIDPKKQKTNMKTTTPRQYTVFHGPYDVGGNAYYLSRGERSHGFLSKTIVYFKQWFGYPSDINLKMKPGANPFRYISWWFWMAKIALTADVIHFNFGGSFLSDMLRKRVLMDLPFWKALGISTFVTFQGCDSRISTYAMSHFEINACNNCRSKELCGLGGYNYFKQEVISQLGKYFDGIYALNPDLMHNIPGAKFLPYSNVDLDDWRPPDYDWEHPGPLRVLHAPTWRELKGSDQVIKTVEELRNEGENIELVLVENIPHDQVRNVYESCDVLIDQILVGWYGGLAVELMALGKPVLAYIRQDDLKFLPAEMARELPVISVTAASLKETLRELAHSRARLREIGQRSRLYVERWHHPDAVAKITSSAYTEAINSQPVKLFRKRDRVSVILKKVGGYVSFVWNLWRSAFNQRLYVIHDRIMGPLTKILFWVFYPLIRLASFIRIYLFSKPASIWGVTPILTLPLLSKGDRKIGLTSKTIVYTTYYITQNFDLSFQKTIEFLAKKAPVFLPLLYRAIFLYSLFRFDVFHYFYDQGFLPRKGRFGINWDELDMLHKAGKRVYLYAYGADVRTRKETFELGEYHCCLFCNRIMVNCICDSADAKQKQQYYQGKVTASVAMGDMIYYVPNPRYMHYWPIDVERNQFSGVKWDGKRPLKILHAPNHSWAKGSWLLEKAIEELAVEGIPFELIKISGKSNQDVIKIMGEIDIVADQFLIGFYGYTALEALARGKIVLCYLRNMDMIMDRDHLPIINTHPEKIKQVLRDLAQSSPEELELLGVQGREYIEKNHSVSAVAGRLSQMYLDTAGFPEKVNRKIKRNISGE